MSAGLTACGDDGSGNENAAGNGIDRAFIREMIPHHESAVEMAKLAPKRAESEFVKTLAKNIITAQEREIALLRNVDRNLTGLKPEDLGVPAHAMGTDADLAKLRAAKPFDREFIDMMVPHHQGAIRMARVELAKGKSETLKILAQDIISAQAEEIRQMNEHRTAQFGGPSPAGGVPPAGEDASKHESH